MNQIEQYASKLRLPFTKNSYRDAISDSMDKYKCQY